MRASSGGDGSAALGNRVGSVEQAGFRQRIGQQFSADRYSQAGFAAPMAPITEDHLEQLAIEWFREIGYGHAFGPELAPDGSKAERANYRQVVLQSRLRSALRRLNPEVPPATIDTAVLQLSNPNLPGLLAANRQMHRWLTQGLTSGRGTTTGDHRCLEQPLWELRSRMFLDIASGCLLMMRSWRFPIQSFPGLKLQRSSRS